MCMCVWVHMRRAIEVVYNAYQIVVFSLSFCYMVLYNASWFMKNKTVIMELWNIENCWLLFGWLLQHAIQLMMLC